jgi:hypothetical protein
MGTPKQDLETDYVLYPPPNAGSIQLTLQTSPRSFSASFIDSANKFEGLLGKLRRAFDP